MQIRTTERDEPCTMTRSAMDPGSGIARLDAACQHDRAQHERAVARFQRPIDRISACHRSAGASIQASLSMASRMLTALVIVVLVSFPVINAPVDIPFGPPPPPAGLDCITFPLRPDPQAPERPEKPQNLRFGMQIERRTPDHASEAPLPTRVPGVNDGLRKVPVWLAVLFAGFGVLFASAAGVGFFLHQAAGLSLCFLLRRANRLGVNVRVPAL